MIWRIKGTSTILMGTVHALDESFIHLPRFVETAYDETTRLVLEIDSVPNWTPPWEEYAGSAKLSDEIDSALYDSTEKLWLELGLDPNAVNRLKPWTAALVLSDALCTTRLNLSPAWGIEARFRKRARRDNRIVEGLELPDAIFAAIKRQPIAVQIAYLRELVEDPKRAEAKVLNVIKWWRTSDIRNFEAFLDDELGRFPSLHTATVFERNESWMPRICELIEANESALVACGALHFVGSKGLPALLERKGFELEFAIV